MSTEKVDSRSLKRASIMSYIMAIATFVTAAAVLAIVIAVIVPYGSLSPSEMSLTLEMLVTIFWIVLIAAPFSIVIQMIFGYYNLKVGKLYDVGSIKLSGISSIVLGVATIPLTIGIYEVMWIFESLISSPPANIFLAFITIFLAIGLVLAMLMVFAILGGALYLIFGVVFIVTFVIGLSNLKQKTGLRDFNIAMWLTIVGLFFWLALPIGIVFYGRGLSKLSKGERPAK